MTTHSASADRHYLDARDRPGCFLRLEFRIQKVLGTREDQRLRFVRGQRLGGVTIKTRCGADIVSFIGLVDPVIGIERLHSLSPQFTLFLIAARRKWDPPWREVIAASSRLSVLKPSVNQPLYPGGKIAAKLVWTQLGKRLEELRKHENL